MRDALDKVVSIGDFVLMPPSSRVNEFLKVAYVLRINPKMLTLQIPGQENKGWKPTSNAYSKQVVVIDDDCSRVTRDMRILRDASTKDLKIKIIKKRNAVSSKKLKNLLKNI